MQAIDSATQRYVPSVPDPGATRARAPYAAVPNGKDARSKLARGLSRQERAADTRLVASQGPSSSVQDGADGRALHPHVRLPTGSDLIEILLSRWTLLVACLCEIARAYAVRDLPQWTG